MHETPPDEPEVITAAEETVELPTPQPAPESPDSAVQSAEQAPAERPMVWIGSWLDYNNGRLHGEWIDADQPDDAIDGDIQAMLARSPTATSTGDTAEDWGVFDFDNFGPLRVGEQETIAWIGLVGRGIAEHGPAFAAYADVMQDAEALTSFEDDYLGHYESVQSYADSFVEDAGYNQLLDDALPDSIRAYVHLDTAAIARDLQLGGDIHAVPDGQGSVWLFAAH